MISLELTLPQICRHAVVSLEILLDLIKIFGPVIHSTLSASSTVGVDIQAEQRYGHRTLLLEGSWVLLKREAAMSCVLLQGAQCELTFQQNCWPKANGISLQSPVAYYLIAGA
jgi:hypothetical protein